MYASSPAEPRAWAGWTRAGATAVRAGFEAPQTIPMSSHAASRARQRASKVPDTVSKAFQEVLKAREGVSKAFQAVSKARERVWKASQRVSKAFEMISNKGYADDRLA